MRRTLVFATSAVLLPTSSLFAELTGWKHSSEPVDPLPVLQDAVWRDRRVRMTCERDGCEATERVVDPLGAERRFRRARKLSGPRSSSAGPTPRS